jgi:hypothetical protein
VLNRNADGTITVNMYDYSTHATIDSFKINPDGSPG